MDAERAEEEFDSTATDPYANVDLDSIPKWWRDTIEEFEAHELPTYRPPVFRDGTLKHRVIRELEGTFDVHIDFIYNNNSDPSQWQVRVDRTPIGMIGHHRSKNGYSVFEMDSDEFVEWLKNYLDNDE